ncbi:hypothetical protein BDV38DRAFT_278043 [Aspergillus pseudotamarii]|uniref:Uncharacterized protein n=1 Tax=Aspergillus pseudotamarii TaxID=132259 RepID=A0A5N6T832_ASPPS|nr:uncharacterized protein BDV38DRAFT_278043 [Aspergillus pseudotamarii]KAE8142515.1 hypothetical protein BDV38DRAFT_278043 [Aspergillus pseudotamarii]
MSDPSTYEPSKAQLRHDPVYYVKPGSDDKEKLKRCMEIFEHQEIHQCFRELEDEPGADEPTIKSAIARKKNLLIDGITVDASLHDLVCVFVDIPESRPLKAHRCLLDSKEELQKKIDTTEHQVSGGPSFDALIPTVPVDDGYVRISYNFCTKATNGRVVYEELWHLIGKYLENRLTEDLPVILGDELRMARTEPRSWRLERGYVHDRNPLGVSKDIFSPAWKRVTERERTRG